MSMLRPTRCRYCHDPIYYSLAHLAWVDDHYSSPAYCPSHEATSFKRKNMHVPAHIPYTYPEPPEPGQDRFR